MSVLGAGTGLGVAFIGIKIEYIKLEDKLWFYIEF